MTGTRNLRGPQLENDQHLELIPYPASADHFEGH